MKHHRKHRHHPDIWREKHLAEKLGERRWWRTPNGAAAHDFWRSINEAALKPAQPMLTLDTLFAAITDVWDSALPVEDAYRIPAGLLVGSCEPHSGYGPRDDEERTLYARCVRQMT